MYQPSQLHSIFRGLLAALIVLTFSFLCVELYFQVIYRATAILPGFLRLNSVKYVDTLGTPRLLADSSFWYRRPDGEENLVKINSLGFRGEEPNSTSKTRIVAVGDSVFFNGALPFEDSVLRLLENNLNIEYETNRTEVLNLAVPDTGIGQYYLKLKNHGINLEPNIALIGLYLNDMYDPINPNSWKSTSTNQLQSFAFLHLKALFSSVSILLNSELEERFEWVEDFNGKTYLKSQESFESMREKARYDWGAAWEKESWSKIRNDLVRIKELTEEHFIELYLVILPVKMQLEAPDNWPNSALPQEVARSLSHEIGVKIFDPLPFLKNFSAEELYVDQCHLSKTGSKVLAQFLADSLRYSSDSLSMADPLLPRPQTKSTLLN